jgi:hypothetical protein
MQSLANKPQSDYYFANGSAGLGINQNFDIVTSGLQLDIRAYDNASYPGTGTTWFDLSGNSRNGTISGATFVSTNPKSFSFDGTNDVVDFTGPSGITQYTLGAWVNTPGEDLAGIVGMGSVASNNQLLWIEILANGNFKSAMFGDDEAGGWSASGTRNVWVYVVGTHDASKVQRGYVNTTLVGTRTANNNPNVSTTLKVGFGRNDGSGQYFGGSIGMVHLYNRALTADEVNFNFQNTRGLFGV